MKIVVVCFSLRPIFDKKVEAAHNSVNDSQNQEDHQSLLLLVFKFPSMTPISKFLLLRTEKEDSLLVV